jgi:hypothetical protein
LPISAYPCIALKLFVERRCIGRRGKVRGSDAGITVRASAVAAQPARRMVDPNDTLGASILKDYRPSE